MATVIPPIGSIRRSVGLPNLVTRQTAVFFLSLCAVIALLVNLVMNVPVTVPMQPDSADQQLWRAAVVAAAIVLGVGLVVASAAVRRILFAQEGAPTAQNHDHGSLPSPLRFEVAPAWAVWVSGAVSAAGFFAGMTRELPDWQVALAMLVPWLPVLGVEFVHRFRIDGFFAIFLLVSLLQAGHMGEHTAQITQLVVHNGNLDRSHGVFGQLDFETVHFFWDTTVWLITAALLYRYSGNGWLWASFTFASLHEVEHMYLYWVFLTDYDYYMAGGLAGIMGKGGVIGSPLYRPYLHFFYNFLVTVPMLIALWMQPPLETGRRVQASLLTRWDS